jgi:hypothetical protein
VGYRTVSRGQPTRTRLILISYPVVIFLSDGECKFDEAVAYDLFRAAVRLGYDIISLNFIGLLSRYINRKPLAFHAVAFGEDGGRVYLQRMTAIAHEIFESAPPDPLIPAGTNPCSFNAALDTVSRLRFISCSHP